MWWADYKCIGIAVVVFICQVHTKLLVIIDFRSPNFQIGILSKVIGKIPIGKISNNWLILLFLWQYYPNSIDTLFFATTGLVIANSRKTD